MALNQQHSKSISDLLDQTLGAVEAAYALADVVAFTITHHITCEDYVEKDLRKFAQKAVRISHSTSHVLLACLTYTDRYFNMPAKQRFAEETTPNIHHKVLLSALLTGHKYVNDTVTVANAAWVKVCGDLFSADQINKMEWEFLQKINYGVLVEDAETQKRWLDTIQDLTEQADTYMMVRIDAKDAISSILSSTGAVSSSCSIGPTSREGSICSTSSSASSTLSSRSNRSRMSMDRSASPRSMLSFESKTTKSSPGMGALMEMLKIKKAASTTLRDTETKEPRPLGSKGVGAEEVRQSTASADGAKENPQENSY
ncbi:hypothetical protein BC830DRAFT_1167446 [Chytriomyces sp. MP71]|nr:hypothetical protein BC830DRAFT_1167446 [Chytriomyces sp. MP71]